MTCCIFTWLDPQLLNPNGNFRNKKDFGRWDPVVCVSVALFNQMTCMRLKFDKPAVLL